MDAVCCELAGLRLAQFGATMARDTKQHASSAKPIDLNDLLPIEEVAARLGYKTTAGVRMAVARGELKPTGRGARNRLFFSADELARFMSDRHRLYQPNRVTRDKAA